MEENRAELAAALKADLGVNDFWVHAIELAGIVKECKALLSGLPSWIQPVVVSTPLLTLPASSSIVPEPYGVCLIIGPWNYPLSLLLQPMAAAFAAGNAVFLKPSEVSVNASAALARLLPRYLDPAGFAVLEGGPDETKALLKEKVTPE